jgi:hypothetical protein
MHKVFDSRYLTIGDHLLKFCINGSIIAVIDLNDTVFIARYSKRCCRRFESSGMLCCVVFRSHSYWTAGS